MCPACGAWRSVRFTVVTTATTQPIEEFRGPWSDGPPEAALVVDAPPVEHLRAEDILRAVFVAWWIVLLVGRNLLAWALSTGAKAAIVMAVKATFQVVTKEALPRVRARSLAKPDTTHVKPTDSEAWQHDLEKLAVAGSEGLVDAFIHLGPTFVKLGQLITSSPGMFPRPLSDACKRCLATVPPFPSSEARRVIAEDLGRGPDELFTSFDDKPLASASIAQVHACVLPDGRHAVLKVQRPGIQKTMNSDLRIQYRFALLTERFEIGKRLGLTRAVAETHKVANQEINGALEAHNQQQFRNNLWVFGDNKNITCAEVYWDYCGPHTICMERLYGVPIDDFAQLREWGVDGELALRRGFKVAVEALCVHGLFHADVHAGNIWVLEDGRGAYLDFGLMGTMTPRWRKVISEEFMTFLIDGDWARLVKNYREVGVLPDNLGTDEQVGMRMQMLLQPLLDRSFDNVNLSEILKSQLDLAVSMGATAPQELMLVVKQLFYFERYVKELAPGYLMAKDLWLFKNVFPEEAAAKAAETGFVFPE